MPGLRTLSESEGPITQRERRTATVSAVDILIMAVLTATVVLILRSAQPKWILALWVLGLVLMLGLFRYHVTSPLDLSF